MPVHLFVSLHWLTQNERKDQMSIVRMLLVASLAVCLFLSYNPPSPANAGQANQYLQLNEEQLDAIIDDSEWVLRELTGKGGAVSALSGEVPQKAAIALFQQILELNGLDHSPRAGMHWYNKGINRGLVYGTSENLPSNVVSIPVHGWQASARQGRHSKDVRNAKRAALRQLAKTVLASLMPAPSVT